MLFGQHFIWVTDFYATKFVLFYDGTNPKILQLQMCHMRWDVNIVHSPNVQLIDADHWSWLGVDIKFNPLQCNYINFTMKTCTANLPPTKYLCILRTCLTTVDQESRLLLPSQTLQISYTFKQS
jgi:hypothetical protein